MYNNIIVYPKEIAIWLGDFIFRNRETDRFDSFIVFAKKKSMINQNDHNITNSEKQFSQKNPQASEVSKSREQNTDMMERNESEAANAISDFIRNDDNSPHKKNFYHDTKEKFFRTERGWRSTLQGKPFLISLAIHLLLFIVILLIISRMPRMGTPFGERSTDSVGIVFSDSGSNGTQNSGASYSKQTPGKDSSHEKKTEVQNNEIPENEISKAFLPKRELLGASSKKDQGSLIKITTDDGQGNGSDSLTDTDNNHNQGNKGSGFGENSGGQMVSFSDVKGNGRKFVFVLDHSESMSWSNGYPMKYALEEARASIKSLSPEKGAQRFQIVVYNHDAQAFGKGVLLNVNEQNKNLVLKFLESVFPQGGTDPVAAMEAAVKMSPDVIFFLTDADEEIPPITLERIHDLARSKKVRQIHVVEFGKSGSKVKKSFRQLAQDNNGQYIFKKID